MPLSSKFQAESSSTNSLLSSKKKKKVRLPLFLFQKTFWVVAFSRVYMCVCVSFAAAERSSRQRVSRGRAINFNYKNIIVLILAKCHPPSLVVPGALKRNGALEITLLDITQTGAAGFIILV